MIFVVRMAVRETRASWRRLLFFFICIAVGVAAIVTLRSVIQSVRIVFGSEARSLLAADVLIGTNREWPAEARKTLVGLRPGTDQEREGLDLVDHGERAYNY